MNTPLHYYTTYYDRIKELLIQDKDFNKILLNDEIQGGKKVKFDAIVGNPPYQETVREASEGNNKNTVDIFNNFQDIALRLSDETCMTINEKTGDIKAKSKPTSSSGLTTYNKTVVGAIN